MLDLAAIGAALEALASDAGSPSGARPLDGKTARRMLAGYAFVDELLRRGRDPLALGGSADLLELNHLVLCGRSEGRRTRYAGHVAATEERFYDDPHSGAAALYDWLERRAGAAPDDLAARLWVRMVSSPQPFIEGNQRTATLAASFVLARAGLAPLVATRDTAACHARLGEICRAIDRTSWRAALDLLLASRRARRLIRETPPRAFLAAAPAPAPGGA